jgi:raffinose/stachyose/melibiose transport system substrate-binding protein
VLFAIGTAAATASEQAPRRHGAAATLHVAFSQELKPGFDAMIGNFERVYPNIHVEAQYAPNAQYPTLLLTQFQAGNPPDVFLSTPGAGSPANVWPLASQGKLLDLTGSPWQKRLYAPGRYLVSRRGKIYGSIINTQFNGLFYNQDVLGSLGVTVPQTFPQLLSFCAKTKAAGKVPISFGAAAASNGTGFMSLIVMTNFVYNLDPKWTIERDAHRVTFAGSQTWHKALQAVVDMKNAGCFQPAPEATASGTAFGLLASGQAAMLIGPTAFYAPLKQINPNLRLGFAAFPAGAAKDTNLQVSLVDIAANANASSPAAAKTFINFLSRPKQQTLFAKISGGDSPYDLSHGIVPDWQSSIRSLAKNGKGIVTPALAWPRTDLLPLMLNSMVGLFTGQQSVDSILNAMDALWDKKG